MRARDNPFRSERIDALRFRDPRITPASLITQWHAVGRRGVVVGRHGTGKTTLLCELASRLESTGHRIVHVRFGGGTEPVGRRDLLHATGAPGARTTLCLDGLDRLSLTARVALRRRIGSWYGVLATSHRPAWLPTLHHTKTTAVLLGSLVDELVPRDVADQIEIGPLFAAHHGNIRDAFFALYGRAAEDRLAPNRSQPSAQ